MAKRKLCAIRTSCGVFLRKLMPLAWICTVTEKKNHHYVPQFYFRRFSKDERSICTLVRSNGRLIPEAPIRGQASKAWYYGDVQTEDALGEIEGHCCQALRELSALENPTGLSAEHVDAVLVHLALQRSRTESARQASKSHLDKFAQLMLEVAINNAEDIDELEKPDILETARKVEGDPVAGQLLEMTVAMQAANALRDLSPMLLVNKTSRPFIFSDAPTVFYNAYCRDVVYRGVLGMSSSGLIVLLPLTSRTCLMLLDKEVYSTRNAANNRISVRDLRDVAALNKLQIHSATNCVYFEEVKYAKYVEALWSDEKNRLTRHVGSVHQGPGFDAATSASIGDIVHVFQPQLAYRPLFTFLKHQVVGESDRRQLRRAGALNPR